MPRNSCTTWSTKESSDIEKPRPYTVLKLLKISELNVALSTTANQRNVFVLTADISNRTKSVVFLELVGMNHNIFEVRKSVVPKYLAPKIGERNRISIANFLNPESGSFMAVLSQYGRTNAERLSKDAIFFLDANYTVFHRDKDRSSNTKRSNYFGVPISIWIDTLQGYLWHRNFQQKIHRDSNNAQIMDYWQRDKCIHDATQSTECLFSWHNFRPNVAHVCSLQMNTGLRSFSRILLSEKYWHCSLQIASFPAHINSNFQRVEGRRIEKKDNVVTTEILLFFTNHLLS